MTTFIPIQDVAEMSVPHPVPVESPSPSAGAPVSADLLWQAVLDRSPEWDGVLYYAVKTTGVFCRSICPSRRPRRENVVFFADPERARAAGFRACKRCRPETSGPLSEERALVLEACRQIERHEDRNPTLAELGRHAGMSPGHFRKLFEGVLGVSQAICRRPAAVLLPERRRRGPRRHRRHL